jgi:hypothetical protein
MGSPSQVPARFPSGVSTDFPWGPLANFGLPNPFDYHLVQDDFDGLITNDELWTVFTNNAGTVVNSDALTGGNGEGGQLLFTTGAAGGALATIEMPKASFILPPAVSLGLALAGKKVFYFARMFVPAVASTVVVAGLINQLATPIIGPTDGLFFTFTNATTVTLSAVSGSVTLWTVNIPAAALALYYANSTWVDFGFYMDRSQNVYAFLGYPLFGFIPASAWTSATQPPPLGAVAAYQVQVSGAWTPSTALLTPAFLVSANAQTVNLDFLMAAKER